VRLICVNARIPLDAWLFSRCLQMATATLLARQIGLLFHPFRLDAMRNYRAPLYRYHHLQPRRALAQPGLGWLALRPRLLARTSQQQGRCMAQITLYIDDALQARLRQTAAHKQQSQSQFVAELIRHALDETWPESVLALAGSTPDFPDAESLRSHLGTRALDVPRDV